MALAFAVVLATAHLEDIDLGMTALCKNGSLDHCAFDEGRANLELLAFADRQHLVERNFLPNVCRYLFDLEFLAGGNTILLATSFYDRVHGGFLSGDACRSASLRRIR